MIDLAQALGSAAHAATATRPTLAAGPVLHRIRRRRAVRVAAESTVGVAAAGAVAFAGVQLAGRDVPTPPASPTSEPTDDPTLTAPPLVTAAGAGALGCGLPVPTLDDPPGDADLHLTLTPEALVVVEGAVDLTVSMVNGADVPAAAPASIGPRVLVAQDGIVVGSLLTPTVLAGAEPLAAGAAREVGGTFTTAACEAQGLSQTPLAAGRYDVVVTWELGIQDVVVGGPWSLTVEAAAVTDEPVDPHPALADLVVSTSGLGPLNIGLSPETNPGAAMIRYDAEYCASEYFEGDDPGRWVEAGYEDDPDRGEIGSPFSVAVDDTGRVGWIDVRSPGPRTAEGVGVGTTVADLQATYPALTGPFDGPVSRVWWLEDAAGILVFETQGDADGLQPAGTPEQVILMRVLLPGADPQFATANSDFVAGGCM